MKTPAKVMLGAGVAAAMLALAMALGKPKRAKPPERAPQRDVPSRDQAPAPTKPTAPSPLQPGYNGFGPVGAPYNLFKQRAGNLLEITDARAMLELVIGMAKDMKVGKFGSARTALTKIAKQLAQGGINRVSFEQIPSFGSIPFAEVTNFLKNVPWGTVAPMAKAWLEQNGLA